MILGIMVLLFLAVAPLIWRRGPDGTGLAFGAAAVVAVITGLFAM